MVLMSMTAAMVDGLKALRHYNIDKSELHHNDMPNLQDAAIGHPIEHAQVISLSKLLKEAGISHDIGNVPFHLDDLLRGSRLHHEPPKPRDEPVSLHAPEESYLEFADRGSDERIQSSDGSPPSRGRGSSIRTTD